MGPFKRIAACLLIAGVVPAALAQAAAPSLTAGEIVERNAAARGGVDAWHKVQTMAWAGHVESSNGRSLPFQLAQQRPDRTRFEIVAEGQKSMRVFDGTSGWKVRLNSTGRPEASPYSDEELRFARGAQVIEGPLMDYVARHGAVTLVGSGEAAGRAAYILSVALPSGGMHRVWVDRENFLELRLDREVRDRSGRQSMVTVFYRDYHAFDGLEMPTTIETAATGGDAMNRLVIERVAVNPPFDEKLFARPNLPGFRRNAALVDTRSAAAPTPPAR